MKVGITFQRICPTLIFTALFAESEPVSQGNILLSNTHYLEFFLCWTLKHKKITVRKTSYYIYIYIYIYTYIKYK